MKSFLVIFIFFFPRLLSLSFEELSIEEKVGQLLMVHFRGTLLNEEAKALIDQVKVGGVIYYSWANELKSKEQVKQLSASLQAYSPIPLIIAADEEGGVVSRIQGLTVFPGNGALGVTGDSELAREVAYFQGIQLKSTGVNLNLAPVVDININPKNPIIGIRSFGATSEIVCQFGKKALEGFRQAKMLTCLKHFPGHGSAQMDSHLYLPSINKPLDQLLKIDVAPFSYLHHLTDAIMTAHLLIPALDEKHCSTFSFKTLNFLRENIGFSGVIISDSLVMEGALSQCLSVEDAALKAFCAGCDILLLGGKLVVGENQPQELQLADIKKIHKHLVLEVKKGTISEKRLNASLKRIYALKEKITKEESLDIEQEMGRLLAKKIAKKALKVQGDFSSLKGKDLTFYAPAKRKDLFVNWENVHFYDDDLDLAKRDSGEVCIFFSENAWKDPFQKTLINRLLKNHCTVVLVAMRDPIDSDLFKEITLFIQTHSPTAEAVEAVREKIYALTSFGGPS